MLSRTQLLASAAAVVALFAFSSSSTVADELVQNLGPAGPNEPILSPIGDKRVVAFYSKDAGQCAVHAVVWNNPDPNGLVAQFWPDEAYSTVRFRMSLKPGQTIQIDTPDNKTLNLQCGEDANTLAVADTNEQVAFDVSNSVSPSVIKASTSGF